jgi:hypothetical protein
MALTFVHVQFNQLQILGFRLFILKSTFGSYPSFIWSLIV